MNHTIKLIAFLGNPGIQYRNNRHNVGWLFCDSCKLFSELSWKRGFKGHWASFETSGIKVYCIKPETYMNHSGEAIQELAAYYQITREEVLVVHDELELPFGFIGIKFGGGLGGHNGLRSMNQHLHGPDFWRLRIGIGRPDHSDIAGYVLSNFNSEELSTLNRAIFPKALELIAPVLAGTTIQITKENTKVKAV
ncbi:MAG TPA: aminoacyl-tRNA hydrolase [Spirochaetales bacterium]|nr:aminoacyl-tRNA hydrolase [Spirochaetales bacterium]HQK33268.1 aminoacyl-tRNA hydrolase [Spirochaetales bacterium]